MLPIKQLFKRSVVVLTVLGGMMTFSRRLATHHLADADFVQMLQPSATIQFRQLTAKVALQTNQDIPVCRQWPVVPYRDLPIQEPTPYRAATSINLGKSMQAYFGTLHSHTSASDGQGNPEFAYRFARDFAGLDFFAITDHPEFWFLSNKNHYEDLKRASRLAERANFIPVYGFEYTNAVFGHYIVLNADKPRTAFQDVTIDSFYAWLKDPAQHSALVAFAHPGFHDYRIDQEFHHFAFDPQIKDVMFGIEVIHWRDYLKSLRGFFGQIPYVDEAARQGFHLAVLGSQDNHGGNWGLRDSTRVGVLMPSLSKENLFTALRKRRTFATSNQNLQFAVNLKLADGSYAMMGETVKKTQLDTSRTLELTVRYFDPGCDQRPARLEVVRDGRDIARYDFADPAPPAQVAFAGEFKIRIPRDAKDLPESYPLYVRFYQGAFHNSYPMAFTQSSPIYIER